MSFGRHSRLSDVMESPQARALLERALPRLAAAQALERFPNLTIGVIVYNYPSLTEAEAADLWAGLAAVDTPATSPAEIPVATPRDDYEGGEVAAGSAPATYPGAVSRWSTFELELAGPSHGNPFTDVELTARFSRDGVEIVSGGFYDGDGRWLIRLLPAETGRWRFVTSSNARSLDGVTGQFDVTPAAEGAHGPVRADGFHFAHADGTRHLPLGTTAYAWIL
ncbi:hypothetical protein Franean1_0403 [Parafrankia sp. EAN1pec]|uniref:DUF5060 domain-containing protein n=1 Tax=Parafrankia sp. (strain EAN1pec) TaxID=298653 RepID=UPI000054078E|nr:hypothetical protein Franean1_0403 [Frankia sp. EAN1pec]